MDWLNCMSRIFLFILALHNFVYSAHVDPFYDLNEHKVESVGSILLVDKDGILSFLFGKLNLEIEEGVPVYNLFYGDLIRDASYPETKQFSDETVFDAARRILAWHFIGITGDPRFYTTYTKDKTDDVRRDAAHHWLSRMQIKGMLRNSNWEEVQRPCFVFLTKYDDIKRLIENRLKTPMGLEGLLEMNAIKFFEAESLIKSLEKNFGASRVFSSPECSLKIDKSEIWPEFVEILAHSFDTIKNIVTTVKNARKNYL